MPKQGKAKNTKNQTQQIDAAKGKQTSSRKITAPAATETAVAQTKRKTKQNSHRTRPQKVVKQPLVGIICRTFLSYHSNTCWQSCHCLKTIHFYFKNLRKIQKRICNFAFLFSNT